MWQVIRTLATSQYGLAIAVARSLYRWKGRIERFMGQWKCKLWPDMCLRHWWSFADYFALLPDHRWTKRLLDWELMGANGLDERNKNFGIFADFCRLKGLPSWEIVATADDLWCSMRVDQQLWESHWDDFINFCRR